MAKTTFFFSVIIPVFNRLSEIQELLPSLEQQSIPLNRFEVLLIDDGSSDGTEAWIKEKMKSTEISLRYFKQAHRGPGSARNLGMQNASGEYFVFVDSDCTVPSNWLKLIESALIRNLGIRGFGGRDDARSDFPSLLLAINYSMTSFLTTGGMRGGKKRRLAKFYPRSFNMGIHRELVGIIGGFGSLRHGQDIEFSHRMIQSGEKVIYIPESVVYHKRRTSLFRFFRQVFNWGVARINLYKMDSGMLEWLHAMPALGFWLAVFVSVAALAFPSLRPIWSALAEFVLVLLISGGLHSGIRWRNFWAGLLTPVVMILQISGYALGFTAAWIWRVLLGRDEWTGFVRKYY
jgi:glycosyltransferase involved in cell wall biosynthesis